MNRKRREANARRAMAAGRRHGPTVSERVSANPLQDEREAPPGSLDASGERAEARVPGPRGA